MLVVRKLYYLVKHTIAKEEKSCDDNLSEGTLSN